MSLRISDVLVLDGKNKAEEGEAGAQFGHPKNPLHNLSHPTIVFIPDDGAEFTALFVQAMLGLVAGHTPLLVVLTPGVATSPKCVMLNEVTLKKGEQVMTLFGDGQEAIAHAIADCVGDDKEKGQFIPKADADKWLCLCFIYIDPAAFDKAELWATIYASVRTAAEKAWTNKQDVEWMLKHKDKVFHPFGAGSVEEIAKRKARGNELKPTYVGA